MPISKKKQNSIQNYKSPYQKVTDKVLELLKKGDTPFKNAYLKENQAVRPVNISTGKEYSGSNVFLLWMANYSSPYWGTIKHFNKEGYKVIKDEKSKVRIIYFSQKESEEESNEEKPGYILKYTPLFNLEQTDCKEVYKNKRIPKGEVHKKIENYAGSILIFNTSLLYASYDDNLNSIFMLPKTSFTSIDEYYSTLFHEMIHWTGGTKQLNRKEPYGDFVKKGDNSKDYAYEELVAEMGSAFITADLGIPMYKQNAGYIDGYYKILSSDEKAFFRAGKEAEKAVKYLYEKIGIGK